MPGQSGPPELQYSELFHAEGEAAADPLADRRHPLLLQAAAQQQGRAGAPAQVQGSHTPLSTRYRLPGASNAALSFEPHSSAPD